MSLLRTAKHAKPSLIRRAAPTAVAGGLSAGLLTIDVAAATAASAATASDFARLRACESGGNYRINTGNGYYGAYQFDLSTWRSVGGSGRPDQASPGTQDALAQRLQSQRGWAPWPACSAKLGLRGGGGSSSGSDSARSSTPTRTTERASAQRSSTQRATKQRVAKQRVVKQRVSKQRVQQRATVRRATPQHSHASTRATTVRGLTPPAFSAGTVIRQDLGRYSPSVRAWQARMAQRGWEIAVDGVYGPQSAGIAAAFAAEKGISTARWGDLDKRVFDGAWRLRVTS